MKALRRELQRLRRELQQAVRRKLQHLLMQALRRKLQYCRRCGGNCSRECDAAGAALQRAQGRFSQCAVRPTPPPCHRRCGKRGPGRPTVRRVRGEGSSRSSTYIVSRHEVEVRIVGMSHRASARNRQVIGSKESHGRSRDAESDKQSHVSSRRRHRPGARQPPPPDRIDPMTRTSREVVLSTRGERAPGRGAQLRVVQRHSLDCVCALLRTERNKRRTAKKAARHLAVRFERIIREARAHRMVAVSTLSFSRSTTTTRVFERARRRPPRLCTTPPRTMRTRIPRRTLLTAI